MKLTGNKEALYRLSVYINNKLVKGFNNKSYTDISVKEGELSVVDINVDTSLLELQEYNSLYMFMVPIDEDTSAEALLLEKSNSIILLK